MLAQEVGFYVWWLLIVDLMGLVVVNCDLVVSC